MNKEQIATFLERNQIGTVGTDIFVDHMPSTCKHGLLLRDYFGGTPIDYELPGYIKARYMLISRAPTNQEAKGLCQAAMNVLTFEREQVIEGLLFKYSRPRIQPFAYPLSTGGLIEYSTNVDCCYVIL